MKSDTVWRRGVRVTARGRPYRYWERVLPRIPDAVLGCVVFLYPTEEAALAGRKAGATAFAVSLPNPATLNRFHYLVTNMHVVGGSGSVFARVNTRNGGVDIVEIPEAEWIVHDGLDDVAATQIETDPTWDLVALAWENVYGIGRAGFDRRLRELNIGVGDDVLMVGRFIHHDGRERNLPMARFGNIAMMPLESVRDGRGMEVEAFLTEMRSLPGFSGSPVFAFIGAGSDRANGTMTPFHSLSIGLLGIDTGHFRHSHEVLDRQTGVPVDPSWRVDQNSGIAIVTPSWKIEELLNQEEFVMQRNQIISERLDEYGDGGASLDTAIEDDSALSRSQAGTRKITHIPKG